MFLDLKVVLHPFYSSWQDQHFLKFLIPLIFSFQAQLIFQLPSPLSLTIRYAASPLHAPLLISFQIPLPFAFQVRRRVIYRVHPVIVFYQVLPVFISRALPIFVFQVHLIYSFLVIPVFVSQVQLFVIRALLFAYQALLILSLPFPTMPSHPERALIPLILSWRAQALPVLSWRVLVLPVLSLIFRVLHRLFTIAPTRPNST